MFCPLQEPRLLLLRVDRPAMLQKPVLWPGFSGEIQPNSRGIPKKLGLDIFERVTGWAPFRFCAFLLCFTLQRAAGRRADWLRDSGRQRLLCAVGCDMPDMT